MRRGEVWIAAGGSGYVGKPRPVVILQDDRFDGTDSVTSCALTTDPTEAPLIRLPIRPDQSNGLRDPCSIMVDKITTVARSKLGERIGRLGDDDMLRFGRAVRLCRPSERLTGFVAAAIDGLPPAARDPFSASIYCVTPICENGGMELSEVQCLVGRVAAVDDSWMDRVALEVAAGEVRRLKSWVEGREVAVAGLLAKVSSFPEKSLADAGRTDFRQAEQMLHRAEIAEQVPGFGVALNAGRVSGEHVDVLGRALRGLQPDLRAKLVEQAPRLLLLAEQATPNEFARTVRDDVRRLERDGDADARLERQRRAVRLNTWLDRASGMGRWSAVWDPETMVKLENRLDGQVQTMFHDRLPDGCPSDPLEKQAYLRALALLALLNGEGARVGRPEIIVVEDHTHPHADGSPTVDWGIPVDLPQRVLDDLYQRADVYTVAVGNGVIIDAPGELNLDRSTRLANRAQRRALNAVYSTCAIPGCCVRYSRTKLHHVIWWRHGGLTNLDNLLPACEVHHHNIHNDGWLLTLTADRTLTITLPDGTIMTTGPPPRRAA